MNKVEIVEMGLNDLILDSRNARKHSKSNVEAIKASLLKFGQQKPILRPFVFKTEYRFGGIVL